MQAYKMDEVIKNVCEKKKLNPELMKSFSDFIFSTTKKEMSMFSNLRIYLRGFIIFFYGKTRLEKFKPRIEERIGRDENSPKLRYPHTFLDKQNEEELLNTKQKVDDLLNVYDEYITEKKTVKAKFKIDRANELKAKIS